MNGARLVDEGVYLSPPPHEHFELCPVRPGVFAGRVDHLSAVGAHTISARVVLGVLVTGDVSQPWAATTGGPLGGPSFLASSPGRSRSPLRLDLGPGPRQARQSDQL